MIREKLFGGRIAIRVSEIADGNMRYFRGDEQEVIKNQIRFCRKLKIDQVARIRTIYDGRENFTEYYAVETAEQFDIQKPESKIRVSDGLITQDKNLGLFLPLADCLGIVFYDSEHEILGLLHAGRHNVEQQGPAKFVEFMKKYVKRLELGTEEMSVNRLEKASRNRLDVMSVNRPKEMAQTNNTQSYFRPENLQVYFSPCARNYEIYNLGGQKLPEVAKNQLLDAGVLPENIIDPGLDTISDPRFPSNSAGDHESRFAIAARMLH